MTSAQTALLFVGTPELVLDRLSEKLNARLSGIGLSMESCAPAPTEVAAFRGQGLKVSVSSMHGPIPAEKFVGAMESPLSRAFSGVLSDTLARHICHMVVSVEPLVKDDTDLLTLLQVAHATTSILVEWHMPGAVHWRHSNQLLTGAQYICISRQTTPWALFTQANVLGVAGPAEDPGPRHALYLEGAADFIGRPILFRASRLPLEEIHAASLSFLRHAVESGEPIPDGHTFGPRGGRRYQVKHIPARDGAPRGLYELSIADPGEGTAPEGTARLSGAFEPVRHAATSGREGRAASTPTAVVAKASDALPPLAPAKEERTTSLAIGFLMLVIMPPIGLLLMLSNALFGSNTWRTSILATAGFAAAMILGAYIFLNIPTQETAELGSAQYLQSRSTD